MGTAHGGNHRLDHTGGRGVRAPAALLHPGTHRRRREGITVKIESIEAYVVGNPWKNWVLVKVMTDEGSHGWGDATCGLSSQPAVSAVREIRRMCVGRDPRDIEALWDTVHKGLY